MSAIDCGNTVHVGNYHGIPTYWPTEDQDRKNVTEVPHDHGKLITMNDIVIGGGSGEHPALVINIDYAVAWLANLEYGMYLNIPGFLDVSPLDVESIDYLYNKIKEEERYSSFNNSILCSVAALVILELPLEQCIINNEVLAFATKLRAENKPWEYFIGFTAVFNCQKYGRTSVQKTDTNGSGVIWGYSLEDWYRDNGGRK